MPFPASIFNSFMGKKKTRPSRSNSTIDELSLVKAAAWAWHQRGSGTEGRPMGEFDIRRMRTVINRPSRYKLEAMKIAEQEDDNSCKTSDSPVHLHCNNANGNNSLLDNYEIESISKRFGQLIDSTTATKLFDDDDDDNGQKTVSFNTSSSNSNGGKTVKKKIKKSGGLWFTRAVICSTKAQDVVVHRPLENRSPVVKSSSSTCPPRVTLG